jgi:hypothetical protein
MKEKYSKCSIEYLSLTGGVAKEMQTNYVFEAESSGIEAIRRSTCLGIPRSLWHSKFRYRLVRREFLFSNKSSYYSLPHFRSLPSTPGAEHVVFSPRLRSKTLRPSVASSIMDPNILSTVSRDTLSPCS